MKKRIFHCLSFYLWMIVSLSVIFLVACTPQTTAEELIQQYEHDLPGTHLYTYVQRPNGTDEPIENVYMFASENESIRITRLSPVYNAPGTRIEDFDISGQWSFTKTSSGAMLIHWQASEYDVELHMPNSGYLFYDADAQYVNATPNQRYVYWGLVSSSEDFSEYCEQVLFSLPFCGYEFMVFQTDKNIPTEMIEKNYMDFN